MPQIPYLCPLCQSPLAHIDRSFRCEKQHQFDIAKEGYVNLLPVQHKASKDPGDNLAMMQARRAFLQQGYYAPLREAVAALLAEHAPVGDLLDIGCGEGYYTHAFSQAKRQVYGLDISKVMIRAASKAYPACHFVVASSQRLPFADNSMAGIVRIYAPCNADELARVCADNAIVLTVTPAPRHLYQLKAMIYPQVHLHDVPAESLPGFRLQLEQQLSYEMQLTGDDAHTLLQMTPFAWRAPEGLGEQLRAQSTLHCEADFMLRLYKKGAYPK